MTEAGIAQPSRGGIFEVAPFLFGLPVEDLRSLLSGLVAVPVGEEEGTRKQPWLSVKQWFEKCVSKKILCP